MQTQTAALTATGQDKYNSTTMRVRRLNDEFRRKLIDVTGRNKVILTDGVVALGEESFNTLIMEVRTFEDFNGANDPYGEHDFGRIDFKGEKYFFKIDYYDNSLKLHSADKSNPDLTRRVLTIMRADEY